MMGGMAKYSWPCMTIRRDHAKEYLSMTPDCKKVDFGKRSGNIGILGNLENGGGWYENISQ